MTPGRPVRARRVVASARGRVELEAFRLPPPAPDQVLIETSHTAISPGTELAFLHHLAGTPGDYPLALGYSGCGRVLDVGAAVTTLERGRRVACNLPHASHGLIAAADCHPLPDDLDDVAASAFRLASIALQGVRKAEVELGSRVAVVGLGPIGVLAGGLAGASGALQVVGVDPLDWRRRLALDVGFDAVAASAEEAAPLVSPVGGHDGGFDSVIEASGAPDAVPLAFRLAARRGRVVLLGSTRGLSDGVDFYRDVHRRGLTVVGAHERNRAPSDDLHARIERHDDALALALMAAGRLRLHPLVSEVLPAADAATAYARLADRAERLMLVALRWS